MSLVVDPPKGEIKFPFICPAARIVVTCSDGRIVVSVAGDLDASTTVRLKQCLQNAIDDGVGRIVVDLAAVTCMDSRSLAVLVHAHRRVAQAGGLLIIIGTAPLNVRLFNAAGLASYLIAEQGEMSG